MTLEEALAKIEQLKALLGEKDANITELTAKITQLEANEKKQNSYITKLEEKAKAPQAPAIDFDKAFEEKYGAVFNQVKSNLIKEKIKEGTEALKKMYPPEIFDAVQEDHATFLKKHMDEKNCSIDYVKDAFYLVYGQAMADPKHKIHQAKGNAPQQQAPNVFIKQQPPQMPSGSNIQTPINTPSKNVASTSDAFKGFIGQITGKQNPFS